MATRAWFGILADLILADLILADPASRGSRVRLQLNPTRITPAPIMLPRLDALDADAID